MSQSNGSDPSKLAPKFLFITTNGYIRTSETLDMTVLSTSHFVEQNCMLMYGYVRQDITWVITSGHLEFPDRFVSFCLSAGLLIFVFILQMYFCYSL